MKKNKKINNPLMYNNITNSDLVCVKKFLNTNPILTQSKKVELFEKKWSEWLGVKYSVFVNSGSSANFLTVKALKYLKNLNGGEILVPSLTWISDIVSVIDNDFKPVFVDINLKNLAMDENDLLSKITKKTVAVFLTHLRVCGLKKFYLL